MKLLLSIIFCFTFLYSSQISPTNTYIASGGVTDLVLKNELLYVATSKSNVDIFDTNTKKLLTSINIPKIEDFMGDIIDSKVYSVDVIDNKIMIVAQGEKGFREVYEYIDGKLKTLISIEKKMYIAKAKYINNNQIILSLLSNQLFLYDIKENKFLWEKQVSESKFSNFALNENKKRIIIADESGSLKEIVTKTGKLKKIYSGVNVDNIFQVDIKKGVIITAGQDRRCGIYERFNQFYRKADFLIYSVGLSPSGKLAGYANNEENNVTIFDTKTKKELYMLKSHKMTLTNILFKNETELFTSSDDNEVYYWKLK